jgi:hypothetical protein
MTYKFDKNKIIPEKIGHKIHSFDTAFKILGTTLFNSTIRIILHFQFQSNLNLMQSQLIQNCL